MAGGSRSRCAGPGGHLHPAGLHAPQRCDETYPDGDVSAPPEAALKQLTPRAQTPQIPRPGQQATGRRLQQLHREPGGRGPGWVAAAVFQYGLGRRCQPAHTNRKRGHQRQCRLDPALLILTNHPLPSGLRALSTAANGRQAVAIDANHTLFFSDDAGAHWNVISPPWQGQALKVALVSPTYVPGPSNRFEAVESGPAVVGGVVSRDSLEGTKSSLRGEVTDPAGASIPSASVVVTNSLTQVSRTTKTDRTGHYLVDSLDPGTYTLEAEAPGFNPQQVSVALESRHSKGRRISPSPSASLSQSVDGRGREISPSRRASPQRDGVSAAGSPTV